MERREKVVVRKGGGCVGVEVVVCGVEVSFGGRLLVMFEAEADSTTTRPTQEPRWKSGWRERGVKGGVIV